MSRVGRRLFELFYAGYTRKVWGCEAHELDPSVCGRIPVRTTRDDRYLEERFQALPRDGYTALFWRLLDRPRVEVLLGAELRDLRAAVRWRHLVYTGQIDEYFDHRLGPLPYRSLRFERQTLEQRLAQPALQVNYPNDGEHTRVVELKHATGQALPVTTIVREYGEAHAPGREAFYPMPTVEARSLHARYLELAAREREVTFLGRLPSYRHLDMDEVVQQALAEADRLGPRLRASEAP
jgi:UDP-galactopyranose mutase